MKRKLDPVHGPYYALATREMNEEHGRVRRGIRFEVVPAAVVEPFLRKDRSLLQDVAEGPLKTALHSWLENGPEDPRFHREKLSYLGAPEHMGLLTVWFEDDTQADATVVQSWYHIAEGGAHDCLLESLEGELLTTGNCSVRRVDPKSETALNQLYRVVGIGTHNPDKATHLRQLQANTLFDSVRFYYVGAALCAGIREAVFDPVTSQWSRGENVGFFDLGFASGELSGGANVRIKAVDAVGNLMNITYILQSIPDQIILFSHLHDDHTSICNRLDEEIYASLFQRAVWYAPVGVSVIFNELAAKINNKNGTLIILPNNNPAQPGSVPVNGNPHFVMGKIDAFAGNAHPHHHGVYARVQVGAPTPARSVLLVGDCTYAGIPQNEKTGIHYLQICHHGGNYAHFPVPQGTRQGDIPTPGQPAPNNMAICSANGFTYHHPNPNYLQEHYNVGWTNPAFVTISVPESGYSCT